MAVHPQLIHRSTFALARQLIEEAQKKSINNYGQTCFLRFLPIEEDLAQIFSCQTANMDFKYWENMPITYNMTSITGSLLSKGQGTTQRMQILGTHFSRRKLTAKEDFLQLARLL